jgi:hypothetical protein
MALTLRSRHGDDQANAGQLDQKGYLTGPGINRTEPGQFGFHGGQLRSQMVEGGQVLLCPQLFARQQPA